MPKTKIITVTDSGAYFTQGVDIDYGTQCDTPLEARCHFVLGLKSTLKHIAESGGKYRDIGVTPADLLAELRAEPGAIEEEIEYE